jgi:hypothetical protein
VNLLVQFFHDPSRPHKTTDMVVALTTNLKNSQIDGIFVFVEHESHQDLLLASIPDLSNSPKIQFVRLPGRMTFADAFAFGNSHLSPASSINVFANADIVFHPTSFHLLRNSQTPDLLQGHILALTRWELGYVGGMKDTPELLEHLSDPASPLWTADIFLNPRIDSQDTWVWRGAVPEAGVLNSDFYQGLPRCDQRIAAMFRNDVRWRVSNPALALRTLHIEGVAGVVERGGEEQGGRASSYDSKKNVHGEFTEVLISTEVSW